MSNDKSYYEILGVSKNASDVEIKKGYRKKVLQYHPDKLPVEKRQWGEEKTKEVNEANDTLKDPEKRKIYDQFGKEGVNGRGSGFSGFPGGFPSGFSGMGSMGGMGGMGGMDNFMSGMFSGRKKKEVPPLQVRLDLTLEEIFSGKDVEMIIKRYNLCLSCDATGFEDKKHHKCTTCNGIGIVTQTMQLGPMIQQSQHPCTSCQGSGKDNTSQNIKCNICSGQKAVKQDYKIKFYVEPGITEENIVEIRGEGHEVPSDEKISSMPGNRGNIQIIIREKKHEVFRRGVVVGGKMNPSNLAIEISLSLDEALCGFKKEFTHLDNKKMYIVEQDIIKPDDTKFIPGKGLPVKGNPTKFGDLFIKYDVAFPQKLNEKQISLLYYGLTGKSIDTLDLDVPNSDDIAQSYDIANYNSSNSYYDQDNQENDYGDEGVACHTQ